MKRPQGVQGQTRQDILNQRLAFQKTRVEALQKAIDARQELMKVLTPEQVKVFDAVESRTHARGPKRRFWSRTPWLPSRRLRHDVSAGCSCSPRPAAGRQTLISAISQI